MCKKSIYLVTFVSVLCLACVAHADITDGLVGYWPLDGDATDASGTGLHGTINGNVTPTTDRFGNADSALLFPGATNSYIELGDPAELRITGAMTLAAWVRIDSYESNGRIIARIGSQRSYSLNVENESNGHVGAFQVAASGSDLRIANTADRIDFGPDEWFHIAGTFEPSVAIKIYINGKLDNTLTDNIPDTQFIANTVRIGRSGTTWGEFPGSIDEVRVYDRALSADDIYELGTTLIATSPDPADGTENVITPLCTWQSGDTASFHDIYFGTNPTLGPAEYKPRQPATWNMYFHQDPLIPGATYYWRIDEVEADGTTTHTGDVWSFTAAPLAAYNPSPSDGARNVTTDVVLSWEAGFTAVTHDVYFGTDETAVADGTAGTFKANQQEKTYTPAGLVKDTDYYWRIDEVEDDMTTKRTGAVWSFRTVPDIAIRDPNMIGWWKLDEGAGDTALDSSGYDHHGTFKGDPEWVVGYDGGALEFDGQGDDRVSVGTFDVEGSGITIACWFKADNLDTPGSDPRMFSKAIGGSSQDHWFMVSSSRQGSPERKVLRFRLKTDGNTDELKADYDTGTIELNEWIHVVATWDGSMMRIYKNGVEVGSLDKTGTLSTGPSVKVAIGNQPQGAEDRPFDGIIDDVRIYKKGVTAAEIPDIMRGDPTLAWKAEPADGSVPDIDQATTLSWTPGENAAKHDVYFGTDRNAVEDADTTTTGIYRGRQDPNTYTPPEGVEFNETYYWRIDEFNTDATLSKGRVWSFTVAEYLIIDDFESYDDYCNRIFYTWPDGWGHNGDVSCGVPAYGGNGTGSTVGYLREPYAEQTIIHEGEQSMPFEYLNDGSTGKALYSETERTFEPPQDWTRHGVKALTLWFRGLPGSVGSFSYDPGTGIYTMTADGSDIWYASDEFHYAYKQLSGVGSIETQVLSVQNTNGWAKAGVMIRDTLDPNSTFAAVYITPGNGCRFQARFATAEDATSDTDFTQLAHIQAPHWIKLERAGGNAFNAYDSNDPAVEGWHPLAWNPQTINMAADLYIGLALTSHNTDPTVACTGTFSDVTITGTVTGQWQSQDIGIASNAAEQLYVAVEDSTGKSKVVNHPDPNAVLSDTYQEWNIDLKQVSDAGVNLASIKKMYIGVGDRNAPKLGGSGMLYIDDIRLYQPRCFPSLIKPAGDFSDNCVVDYPDLETLADNWLRIVWDTTGGHDGSGCLVFGPSGDYVAIQDLHYQGNDYAEVSVCAWVRTDSDADQYIVSFDRNEYWRLEVNGSGAGLGQVGWDVMTDTGQVDYGSAARVDDGQWHHVVGVFDNGTLTIYIDGSAEPSATGGPTFGTGNTRFGFLGANSEAIVFDGSRGGGNPVQQLDDFRIYDYALLAGPIVTLYNGSGQPATSPILWYKLDETSGSIAADSSGNGYDGSLMFDWFDINLYEDGTINFKDYAVLADSWLDELLWP